MVHHLVVERRVLARPAAKTCNRPTASCAAAGQTLRLPGGPAPGQLQAHAQTLNAQLAYWQAQTADADLPCDNPRGGLQNRLGANCDPAYAENTPSAAAKTRRRPIARRSNELLLTALARVVCRRSGQAAALSRAGRPWPRRPVRRCRPGTGTVGWFTSLFPVRLRPGTASWARRDQGGQGATAVPCPTRASATACCATWRRTQAPAKPYAGLAAPRITFNYLGQFDRQFDESALFVPATRGSGQAQDPEAPLANWLTLEGQVYGGELTLQWGFSREMFQVSTIQRLADDYTAELKALIRALLCHAGRAGRPRRTFRWRV